MKNSLRIHKWTHNEFNIFILGVLTHPRSCFCHCHVGRLMFVWRLVPETKGKTLEEISMFWKKRGYR